MRESRGICIVPCRLVAQHHQDDVNFKTNNSDCNHAILCRKLAKSRNRRSKSFALKKWQDVCPYVNMRCFELGPHTLRKSQTRLSR